MDFVNSKIFKIVPKAMGNSESELPAACYVEKLSGKRMADYSATLREKNIKSDSELFCLIANKVENFILVDPDTGEKKELTTAEEVVDIPGIMPLMEEVLEEFNKINSFGGESKNVPLPSSV